MIKKQRSHGFLHRTVLCFFLMTPALWVSAENLKVAATEGAQANSLVISELAPPQQQKTHLLEGKVLDASTNEPVIGAAVQVQGRTGGEVTDLDGNFSIRVSDNAIITVSSLGYKPYAQNVGTRTSIVILLSPDTEALEEVVVTAFGVGQKKESVVGSVQLVRPESLLVPSANLSTAFAGRLAGVVSYQRSGMPGQNGSDFYIRGISTISGVTSPLIILDGVEISSGDLNAIDPEIIEGFSILKDATATAMYGTRGANGVMIITTKSGKDLEKPIIGIRFESNVTTPTKLPKFVSGSEYMRLFNEAVTNQGTGDVLYSKEQIEGTLNARNPYAFPNMDWYKEIFRNYAFNQKANFNIRGGTSKITYFMNLTANHETGMLRNRSKEFFSFNNGIDVKNFAFQNNIDFHMSPSATISLHLTAQLNDVMAPAINANQTSPGAQMGEIYSSIMGCNPVDFPAWYPSEEGEDWIRWGALNGGNNQGASNPLAQSTRGYGNSFASTVIANIDYEQKLDAITKGLRFKAMVSFKNWSKTTTNRTQRVNRYYLNGYTANPDGTYTLDVQPFETPTKPVLGTTRIMQGDHRFYFQTFLDYNRTFGRHGVSGMLLFNMDELARNDGGDLISSLPYRKIGYAARLSYDYDHRYLLEFNAGYNGSENFAKGHRYGFFPSIAVGWNVSSEKFWEPVKPVISRLKLRGSYGLVGNDQIGGNRFIYMADVTLQNDPSFRTGYGQGSNQKLYGPKYKRFQNNDITWEVGHKLNVGVDIELYKSLSLAVDAFQEIRTNIFQKKLSIPNYLGAAGTDIFGNLAKVKSWGFDLAADYGKRIGKDFYLQFMGTFTFARNRVIEYDEAPGTRPANSKIGHPVSTIYGFVTDGLYIDQADIDANPTSTLGNIAIAPGDIKYVDQPDKNGEFDGKITTNDDVAMGYPTIPEIVYGFGPTMTWKDLDFSFFIQGAARTSLMMSGFHPFGTQYNRNVLAFVAEDRWSPTNQNVDAAYPRLTKFENNHNSRSSDFWLRDASFLKLKNIEVGYRINKVRIYANALNVLTLSKFKLWDPEMGGGAGMQYPTQRTFNVGLQVTF